MLSTTTNGTRISYKVASVPPNIHIESHEKNDNSMMVGVSRVIKKLSRKNKTTTMTMTTMMMMIGEKSPRVVEEMNKKKTGTAVTMMMMVMTIVQLIPITARQIIRMKKVSHCTSKLELVNRYRHHHYHSRRNDFQSLCKYISTGDN
jgi:hypothetical protein